VGWCSSQLDSSLAKCDFGVLLGHEWIESLRFFGEADAAFLQRFGWTISKTDTYSRAVLRRKWLRPIDDADFLLSQNGGGHTNIITRSLSVISIQTQTTKRQTRDVQGHAAFL